MGSRGSGVSLPPSRARGGRPKIEHPDALTDVERWLVILCSEPEVWRLVDEWPKHLGNGASSIAVALRRRGCKVSTRNDGDVVRAYALWPHDRPSAEDVVV